MAYIEFKNVSKIYKSGDIEVKALDNVNFEIEQGELVCILGHSGAGKTTALNILGGMDKATSGKITVARKEITKYNKKEEDATILLLFFVPYCVRLKLSKEELWS